MELNVYKGTEIEKTYKAESYDLMFGIVEDIMQIFNVDALKTNNDSELIKLVTDSLPRLVNVIKPMLKDIFNGLTDEELRRVKAVEVAEVVVEIIKYAFEQIANSFGKKN